MTAPLTVRAGDREREQTSNLLGQALAQGYFSLDEYETRLQTTFAAHTTAELHALVADLPLDRIRRNDPARRQARRRAAWRGVQLHFAAYLAMVVIVLTVWLVVGLTAGAWYFWPVWPILGAGIGVIGHAVPIRFAVPGGCAARQRVQLSTAATSSATLGTRSSAQAT
ncbi:MAG: DUF1707 domain-containing protein [Mycobacteriaceae bacterium]|nr:DUF1707 domain-containing protein [Mycobacteriaceae bacterium]